ncbi:hypothetical protein PAGA_a0543 [Pseudoalteromonas agarivorans DSM 14585]|uniref:Uncharacterized protein n=1 Tax=Pseudoalteromonas agarivorans DSM 14585 TaxID=1312369 RepID=A0ACA8DSW2_9GAMM|nr:hypothetical protein PAGA_a0543 [Pseudoalteromonas agarivorans DSM 14585]
MREQASRLLITSTVLIANAVLNIYSCLPLLLKRSEQGK